MLKLPAAQGSRFARPCHRISGLEQLVLAGGLRRSGNKKQQ